LLATLENTIVNAELFKGKKVKSQENEQGKIMKLNKKRVSFSISNDKQS